MTYKKKNFWKVLHLDKRIAEFIHLRISGRIKWWKRRRKRYHNLKDWKDRVRKIFYRHCLRIVVEGEECKGKQPDGTVVYEDENTLIIDWRSDCPVLRDCQEQGTPTLRVCSTLYHLQYQALLSLISPGTFFARDYSRLRPNQDHCREIIVHVPEIEEYLRTLPPVTPKQPSG